MKNIIILITIVSLLSFTIRESIESKKNKFENELIMLKNQAFCNLFNVIVNEDKQKLIDDSDYFQISELSEKYYRDERLIKLIEKWRLKKYKSYNPDNKLYLMKCLDFYNSKDLKVYLDSVRKVESKKE